MHKVSTLEEFNTAAKDLLKHSDLIVAQEFLPSSFDWRVGVLNGQPLYVCKYYMARNHWQIVKHEKNGNFEEGDAETLAVEDAPGEVVDLAVKAANLIGNGIYGVDIKQTPNGLFVIEINDNPSIEAGCEDKVLGLELYKTILRELVRRIEA